MEIICLLQRDYRTIAIVKNRRGEVVGRLNIPRLVTIEELGTMADKYREEHPEYFPERKRGKNARNKNQV